MSNTETGNRYWNDDGVAPEFTPSPHYCETGDRFWSCLPAHEYYPPNSGSVPGTVVIDRAIAADPSQDTFHLSQTPAGDVLVFVDGSIQRTDSYTVSGTTVTFNTAVNGSAELTFSY